MWEWRVVSRSIGTSLILSLPHRQSFKRFLQIPLAHWLILNWGDFFNTSTSWIHNGTERNETQLNTYAERQYALVANTIRNDAVFRKLWATRWGAVLSLSHPPEHTSPKSSKTVILFCATYVHVYNGITKIYKYVYSTRADCAAQRCFCCTCVHKFSIFPRKIVAAHCELRVCRLANAAVYRIAVLRHRCNYYYLFFLCVQYFLEV